MTYSGLLTDTARSASATITRKAPSLTLLIAGSVETQAASDLVDYYLNKFTEQDERRKAVLGFKGP